jgi:hypothetical protein
MSFHNTTIETEDGKELEVTVEYTATRPSRGRSEYPGGPPMEPDEEGGVEIHSIIRDDNKQDIIDEVSEQIINQLEIDIMESLADDYED